MGRAKEWAIERESQIAAVISRLVDTNAAYQCEVHGYAIDNGDDEAVQLVRDELTVELGEAEADALISDAVSQLMWECPGCAKNDAE